MQTADKAQQAFSYSSIPTLYNAIPALEKLFATWEKQRDMPETERFKNALDAALQKVNEYYEKTSESDAHIMAMRIYFIVLCCEYKLTKFIPVLHPKRKMKYFKKNWSKALQKEVLSMAETIVCTKRIIISFLILTRVVIVVCKALRTYTPFWQCRNRPYF